MYLYCQVIEKVELEPCTASGCDMDSACEITELDTDVTGSGSAASRSIPPPSESVGRSSSAAVSNCKEAQTFAECCVRPLLRLNLAQAMTLLFSVQNTLGCLVRLLLALQLYCYTYLHTRHNGVVFVSAHF